MPAEPQPKMPNPIYAAAGVGDLAIERLRKLPEKVADLQERVNTLQDELPGRITVIQDRVTQKVAEIPSIVAELRQKVVDTDADRLRETARRNAGILMANAQAAQERATAFYDEMVARGEQVVGRSGPAKRSGRVMAEVISTGRPERSKPAARSGAKPASKSTSASKPASAGKPVSKSSAAGKAAPKAKRAPKA